MTHLRRIVKPKWTHVTCSEQSRKHGKTHGRFKNVFERVKIGVGGGDLVVEHLKRRCQLA